jgi:hypothetical protein
MFKTRILGWLLVALGFLCCATVTWTLAAIGFVLMSFGLICLMVADERERRAIQLQTYDKGSPTSTGTLFTTSEAWQRAVEQDPNLARIADVLGAYGQNSVEQFAGAYLDRCVEDRIPSILSEVATSAFQQRGGRWNSEGLDCEQPANSVEDHRAERNNEPMQSVDEEPTALPIVSKPAVESAFDAKLPPILAPLSVESSYQDIKGIQLSHHIKFEAEAGTLGSKQTLAGQDESRTPGDRFTTEKPNVATAQASKMNVDLEARASNSGPSQSDSVMGQIEKLLSWDEPTKIDPRVGERLAQDPPLAQVDQRKSAAECNDSIDSLIQAMNRTDSTTRR